MAVMEGGRLVWVVLVLMLIGSAVLLGTVWVLGRVLVWCVQEVTRSIAEAQSAGLQTILGVSEVEQLVDTPGQDKMFDPGWTDWSSQEGR